MQNLFPCHFLVERVSIRQGKPTSASTARPQRFLSAFLTWNLEKAIQDYENGLIRLEFLHTGWGRTRFSGRYFGLGVQKPAPDQLRKLSISLEEPCGESIPYPPIWMGWSGCACHSHADGWSGMACVLSCEEAQIPTTMPPSVTASPYSTLLSLKHKCALHVDMPGTICIWRALVQVHGGTFWHFTLW